MRASVTLLLALGAWTAHAEGLLPWQRVVEVAVDDGARDLEPLFDLTWRSSGGKEGDLSLPEERGPWGGRQFLFHVEIDHHNEGQYPMGWPSFETCPSPPLDFSGFDAIQYWIRADTAISTKLRLRFILWSDGRHRLNELIEPFAAGEWVRVTQRISDLPAMDRVDRIHFFLCEDEYRHGEIIDFRVGGFRLCQLGTEVESLEPDQAAAGLWAGKRADTGDQMVIADEGTPSIPGLLVVETAAGVSLRGSDTLAIRYHEVFTNETASQTRDLGLDVPAGTVARVQTPLETGELAPGYYLVVADILRDGTSVLGGRVGSDDFYIRARDEPQTYTVLSIRTGMVQWVRDLIFGDIMCRTRIALPHVYDPLNKETYTEFLDLFAHTTGKHTEGNEAGDTGLVLAAEAFRKSGDLARCRFTEGLLEDSFRHMIEAMQAPSGGTITWTNELAAADIGKGGMGNPFGRYDSNQMGEWIRPLAYGIIYYAQQAGRRDYAKYLSEACRKAAGFVVAHSLQESDGVPDVLRHLDLQEAPDGTVSQVTYHQEGRQCDVYLGRALSGLSYYAYAMQLLGETVPESWWRVMDNTVRWCDAKMKPNGWFDWQCEDVVEGGCHTFLGNIYVGEGLFGCYIASKYAGREDQAEVARRATNRAYRYVTDDCWIRGRKYEYPLEFWVGPYVYWLFTEYLDAAGPDERLSDWLTVMDERWTVERGWRDFLDRAPTGGCGRTETNGMLEVSILGYLGIKQMQEVGQPLHWPTAPE